MNATTRRAAISSLLVASRGRFGKGTNAAVEGGPLPAVRADEWHPVYDSKGRKVADVKGPATVVEVAA